MKSNISDICNVVGIDRSVLCCCNMTANIEVGFVSGKAIKQKRANYSNFVKRTSNARRHAVLRTKTKAISPAENRWMQDINHQVSKALATGNQSILSLVLEDLAGIRNATGVSKTKRHYVSISWSFYDLEQKLIYKQANQSSVIKVDPRYTSQCCPACGHTESLIVIRKIHLFTCKSCDYTSNDDPY